MFCLPYHLLIRYYESLAPLPEQSLFARITISAVILLILFTHVGEAFAVSKLSCANMSNMQMMMDFDETGKSHSTSDNENCCDQECNCPKAFISMPMLNDTSPCAFHNKAGQEAFEYLQSVPLTFLPLIQKPPRHIS